jgi:hypothetical protein
MAYELFPAAHGAILRGELEETYNSGVSVPDASVYRAPIEATFNSYDRTFLPRQTQAAYISGVKASPASARAVYSIEVVLDHQALDGTTIIGTEGGMVNVPQADIFWRAGGWVASYSPAADYTGIKPDTIVLAGGSNDRILTYTYKPRSTGQNFTSARFKYTEISESAEGLVHDIKGARHGWTLNMPGGEHWTLACDGMGVATKPVKDGSPTINSTFDDSDAIVGLGGNYSVTKFVTSDATFGKTGGETADASSMQAFVYNMSLASNLEIAEIQSGSSDRSVAQVRYSAGVPQLTCTLDQVVWDDDWDLYTFADNANAIRVSHACPLPGSTTSFVLFSGTFQITNIVRGSDNGYRNVELTMDYVYPQNSSDDGGLLPEPGITFKYITIV